MHPKRLSSWKKNWRFRSFAEKWKNENTRKIPPFNIVDSNCINIHPRIILMHIPSKKILLNAQIDNRKIVCSSEREKNIDKNDFRKLNVSHFFSLLKESRMNPRFWAYFFLLYLRKFELINIIDFRDRFMFVTHTKNMNITKYLIYWTY